MPAAARSPASTSSACSRSGPESAGAEPGPASYGRGGTEPAVTDADVVLGLLDPAGFLGGDMPLDARPPHGARRHGRRARSASTPSHTAAGIHEIVNQNMAAAARMHAVEQGVDLRGVSVLAFGGAGPVHACGVAELLESDRVVFPVNASVLSAFGTLVSPVRIDLARSMPRRLDAVDAAERDALLDELRAEGRRVLAAAGASARRRALPLRARRPLHRAGQRGHGVGRRGRASGRSTTTPCIAAFEAEYRRIYG